MTWLAPLLAAAVSGTVYLRQGDVRRPLAGARVVVSAPGSGPTLRTATTDALGRYRLDDFPRKRLVLRADAGGYFTRAVASRQSTLVLDLSGGGELSAADFEAQPGGVITGRLTDAWGDPLDKIAVILASPGHSAQATTDDRGLYRAWGLPPGRYQVRILPPGRRALLHPSSPVEVSAGQEIPNLDLVVRAEPRYEVRGRVAGLPPEDLRRARVKIQPLSEEDSAAAEQTLVDAGGSFVFPRLPAGAYLVTLLDRNDTLARQHLDLAAGHSGLLLRPTPLGALTGRVAPVGRARPPLIWLQALDRAGQEAFVIAARPPDYLFDLPSRWPDTYTLRAGAPPGAYVLDPHELVVAPGGTTEVVIRVGLDPGRVSGIVKAPHGRVLLRGKNLVRTEQSDQNGRFEITDLPPGEYRISEHAFTITPNSHIELDLTATP
jgi:hypothetical protein